MVKKFIYILLFSLILNINICSATGINPNDFIYRCNQAFQMMDSMVAQDLLFTQPRLIESHIYESLLTVKMNNNRDIWGKIFIATDVNGYVFAVEQVGLVGPLPAMFNSSIFTYAAIMHTFTNQDIPILLKVSKDHHYNGNILEKNIGNFYIKNLWDMPNNTHFIYRIR